MISEEEVEIELREWGDLHQSLKLEFLEEGLKLQGQVVKFNQASATVRIKFEQVSLQEQRKLVELLYCRSEQWESQQTPGEWHSLWLLLKLLLRPFVLLFSDRKRILAAVQR